MAPFPVVAETKVARKGSTGSGRYLASCPVMRMYAEELFGRTSDTLWNFSENLRKALSGLVRVTTFSTFQVTMELTLRRNSNTACTSWRSRTRSQGSFLKMDPSNWTTSTYLATV